MVGFKWIQPEVYPLFLAVGTAVALAGFSMTRNLSINPDVRVNKDDRLAGVLENYEEGKTYRENALRKTVHDRRPEIMPSINASLYEYLGGSEK